MESNENTLMSYINSNRLDDAETFLERLSNQEYEEIKQTDAYFIFNDLLDYRIDLSNDLHLPSLNPVQL